MKLHFELRRQITRSGFAGIRWPENQNPAIPYADAAAGQSSEP
jgi:hypothetical protein